MRLKDRVALVTGMASGIGQGIAELFAAEGAAVIGLDINREGGSATIERIRSRGGRGMFQAADVGSEKDVQDAVEAGLREFGAIDIVANVAGIASEAPLHLLELSEWERVIRVNLTSIFLTSKYVLPNMLARKRGSIVSIASTQGLRGFQGYPHYSASKGGIISLTRQMAVEYGGAGIRVNCIAPCVVETAMTLEVLSRAPDPEKIRAGWDKMHPLGRSGRPIDIASGALYLVSDESSWVTGICLVIDGGATSAGVT